MVLRYVPKDDWLIEEYDDCQKCGCWKPFGPEWYCDECDKEIEVRNRIVLTK